MCCAGHVLASTQSCLQVQFDSSAKNWWAHRSGWWQWGIWNTENTIAIIFFSVSADNLFWHVASVTGSDGAGYVGALYSQEEIKAIFQERAINSKEQTANPVIMSVFFKLKVQMQRCWLTVFHAPVWFVNLLLILQCMLYLLCESFH